jgi:hypothetical protein
VRLRLAQLIMFVIMTGCVTGFAQAGPRGRGPRGPGMAAQDAQLDVQDAMQRAYDALNRSTALVEAAKGRLQANGRVILAEHCNSSNSLLKQTDSGWKP